MQRWRLFYKLKNDIALFSEAVERFKVLWQIVVKKVLSRAGRVGLMFRAVGMLQVLLFGTRFKDGCS